MRYSVSISIILFTSLFFVSGIQAEVEAQCSGGVCTPPPSMEFETASAGAAAVELHTGSSMVTMGHSIMIKGEGISIAIIFAMDERTSGNFQMSNGERPFSWEPGVISLQSYSKAPGIVNLDAMPPAERELWDKARALIGDLIEDQTFWEFIEIPSDEGPVMAQLEAFRDGYFHPSSIEQYFLIQASLRLRGYGDYSIERSYTLGGFLDLSIGTTAAPGTLNPVLNITYDLPDQSQYMNRWQITIDPSAESIIATYNRADPSSPLGESDYLPIIAEIRNRLGFFESILPSIVEGGFMEPDSEVISFVRSAIIALDSKPIEMQYEYREGYSEYFDDIL